MDMRRSLLFFLGLAILLTSNSGCRQTTGSSALTPIGAGTVGPLAPVGGGTAAASLSPLGQPTRVPPPSTGSHSTPNNYLGGTATTGQAYVAPAPYDSFSNVAPNPRTFDSGVAPTGWSQPNVESGFAPATNQNPTQAAPPLSPNLGGMRVIDMTQAPPPPGYQPQYPAQQYQRQPFEPSQFQGVPFNPATGNFAPQTIHVPRPGEIAAEQGMPRVQPNGQFGPGNQFGPSASIAQRREFPMQPSPLEPSFQGSNQFPTNQPSTEPIDNSFGQQQENLPWRRPGAQF